MIGHWTEAHVARLSRDVLFVDAACYTAGSSEPVPGRAMACIGIVVPLERERDELLDASLGFGGDVLVHERRLFVHTTYGPLELRVAAVPPGGAVRNFHGELAGIVDDPCGGTGDGLHLVMVQLPRRRRTPRQRILILPIDVGPHLDRGLPELGAFVRGSHYGSGHACVVAETGEVLRGALYGQPAIVPNLSGRSS